VRLELNGKVIGQKQTSDETRLTAIFAVPYSAGELKTIGMINGKEVATKVFKTAGKPSHLILSADRNRINADRNDLAYVSVEVRDKDENLVPNTDINVKFTVSDGGELLASGNAAPDDMRSFRKPECKTFNGKCLAIIRPYAKAGSIKVNAEAVGLPNAMIEIQTR
jgi:beta-galactosidase